MKAATRRPRRDGRLMILDPGSGRITHLSADEFDLALGPTDLLVLNDAATLPASLMGRTHGGDRIEARLVAPEGTFGACNDEAEAPGSGWWAVLFGEGSWRDDTDTRPSPPRLEPGATLSFGAEGEDPLVATVDSISCRSDRLVRLRFDRGPAAVFRAVYRLGRPIQYRYHPEVLPLAAVQTAYADRPWAVEMPSAGRSLTTARLERLRAKGVQIVTLTHGAGLSATGDPGLDAALPLPERYEIPAATAGAVQRTLQMGGRVIAVGTGVVRALEGNAEANGGRVRAGRGTTNLVIRASFVPRVVTGLLSGVHLEGESHHDLLAAFAPPSALAMALQAAEAEGYENHEFGDAFLVLPEGPRPPIVRAGDGNVRGRRHSGVLRDVSPPLEPRRLRSRCGPALARR